MRHRDYTPEERANALTLLRANGNNVSLTSRMTGVGRNILRMWREDPRYVEAVESKTANLADLFEDLTRRALSVASDKLEGANFRDLIVGIGIMTDKAQLLRGAATEHTGLNGGPIEATDLTRLTDEQLQQLDKLLGVAQPAAPPEPN